MIESTYRNTRFLGGSHVISFLSRPHEYLKFSVGLFRVLPSGSDGGSTSSFFSSIILSSCPLGGAEEGKSDATSSTSKGLQEDCLSDGRDTFGWLGERLRYCEGQVCDGIGARKGCSMELYLLGLTSDTWLTLNTGNSCIIRLYGVPGVGKTSRAGKSLTQTLTRYT